MSISAFETELGCNYSSLYINEKAEEDNPNSIGNIRIIVSSRSASHVIERLAKVRITRAIDSRCPSHMTWASNGRDSPDSTVDRPY